MITGTVKRGSRTKTLIRRLKQGDVALINHPDLDEVAADGLRRAKVRAVLNGSPSITGRYPNLGPSLLLAADVPLFDVDHELAGKLQDGDNVSIDESGTIRREGELLGRGVLLSEDAVRHRLLEARANLPAEVERFIDNTLRRASREKRFVVEPFPLPPLKTAIEGRCALVVVRGHRHRADLAALAAFIDDMEPALIGVDGGADALLEIGRPPDLVVGDMDSVGDEALAAADDVVVHAYPDGRAPGLQRVRRLGLPAHVVAAPGTSEDLAMLLAYEAGAELIVAVGTHSNLIDFLEKGREGMASTFLVRLKVGPRLIDARGVSLLYRTTPRLRYPVQIALAAMVPFVLVLLLGDPLRHLLRLAWLQLRLAVGW